MTNKDNDITTDDIALYKGIFWIVDTDNIEQNKNYCFKILCSTDGSSSSIDSSLGIAKSGDTYNHQATWNKLSSFLTHNKPYNYFPRGRVEIKNGVARIFLNGNINYAEVIYFIKSEFNLTTHNGIKKVSVIEDNSAHYLCYLDDGYKSGK
ncbi:MAG: hypothetical protein J1F69_01615 [Clostridiales bacterium]|nr:hypothetical protein [Clostridiales bacterium]